MNTQKIVQLVGLGELAIELVDVERAAGDARERYHLKIREYERKYGGIPGHRIDPDLPAHAPALRYTAAAYEKYQEAQRKKYQARAKLKRAVDKAKRS